MDQKLKDRFSSLLSIRIAERSKQFSEDIKRFERQAARDGQFRGGSHAAFLHRAHESELEIRAILAWESLVRAHKAQGSVFDSGTAPALRAELHRCIKTFANELTGSLREHTRQFSHPVPSSLSEKLQHVLDKHDVEVDFYEDSLVNRNEKDAMVSAQYNFYGSVGNVQTGAHSQANVVQNLGDSDKSALLEALQLARDAIQSAVNLGNQRELLEIADSCKSELKSESPNSTRLLAMFNVLAGSVQTMASAQPAYQALKTALIPLGVTLP